MLKAILAGLFCLAPALSSAYCFLVYNASGQLVYRSVYSPVDLSIPLSQGLAARYPGGHLIFLVDESSCLGFEQSDNARTRARGTRQVAASSDRDAALEASPLFVDSKPLGGHEESGRYGGAAGARAAGNAAPFRSDPSRRGASAAPSGR